MLCTATLAICSKTREPTSGHYGIVISCGWRTYVRRICVVCRVCGLSQMAGRSCMSIVVRCAETAAAAASAAEGRGSERPPADEVRREVVMTLM